MTDQEITNYFYIANNGTLRQKINGTRLKDIPDYIREYLENRFKDSTCYKETIQRIRYGIYERPVCPICGGSLVYSGKPREGLYSMTCSASCGSKLVAQRIPIERKREIQKIGSKARMDKAIAEGRNYQNVEKFRKTNIERYGCANAIGNPAIQEKVKASNRKHFGTDWYFQSDDCKKKTIEALGTDNYWKTEKSRRKTSEVQKERKEEIQKKREETFLNRYGVSNPMRSPEILSRYDFKEKARKGFETKKKNNSYKKSDTEDLSYQKLIEVYHDTIRQYRSREYPFYCDFYIPSIDLYIECNYFWTHGPEPYDINNFNHQEIVQRWKDSDTDFFRNAIKNWTITDVKKRKVAKENDLNYIEFFDIEEFIRWIENIKKQSYINNINR